MHNLPLISELPYIDPIHWLTVLPREGIVFLDSAAQGRYSFIAVDPFLVLRNQGDDPLAQLARLLDQYPLSTHAGYPPFQGGAAGMFEYDFPNLILGFYDLVLAFDHSLQQAWVFSSGYPEKDENIRLKRAAQRLQWVTSLQPITFGSIPTQFTGPIHSNFTQASYETAVKKVIEYIRAGDIFQANIAQCFSATLLPNRDPLDLYRRLRKHNPAPFAAFLQMGELTIASASPERFIKLENKSVQTRPIKGTCKRDPDPIQDKILAQALANSEKDRAENIMIVDLMRNDISRVCLPHSVIVSKLCGVESFATVHHLVSVVEGELAKDKTAVDLLKATFPGGSITGAPKIRAMEIIAEIEQIARGPYCGSMGYIGFNGDMDLSITIRTLVLNQRRLSFHTGGAVTVDSDPQQEYEETLLKAKALQETLQIESHYAN